MVRVIGQTEDVNQCEHCGRSGLRRTVVLDIDGERVYYGTSCAANTHPSLGVAADINARSLRMCDRGCGEYATNRFASGKKLCTPCKVAS